MLLAYGSEMDDTDGQGRTPLMSAAQQGNSNILEVLIENRADVHLKDQDGTLHYIQQPDMIKTRWPRCYLLMAVK